MLLGSDTRDVGISNIRPRVSAHEIKMMCVQQVYPNKPLTIIVVANGYVLVTLGSSTKNMILVSL